MVWELGIRLTKFELLLLVHATHLTLETTWFNSPRPMERSLLAGF